MKNILFRFYAVALATLFSATAHAEGYSTYLTPGRGFTKITTAAGLLHDSRYCYILTAAEDANLIVGIGRYEAKPGWAGEDTKALRYKSATTDPVADLSNFFTIEKSGSYIGLRNIIYNTDLFQTHDNAGYMYVNTYTDKLLDEWSYLTPTYQNGYWLFESGKYPMSSENWACGYLGPWNKSVAAGEPIALNRKNTSGDEAGHYRLFRIAKADLMAQYLATLFTPANGFTEVTTTDDILADDQYCYLLTSAENSHYYVGVGKYELKPDWAGEDTKALRYRSAEINPLLDLSNFFTIEKSGSYIGLRNMYYSSSLFQTHALAGYMFVLTYTEPVMSDWCYLIPTYQNGYWLFENGKYPVSSEAQWKGYMGPWTPNRFADEEPIALNRLNTSGDEAGHYRLFRIAKTDLVTKHNQLLQSASDIAPIDVTARITNPSFETGDETGWTLIGKDPNGNDEFKTREYGMTGKDGDYLMNAYQWWATSLSVKQTVTGLPSGTYELSAVVASWEGRSVTFSGNQAATTGTGINDATGVPVSVSLNIANGQKLIITAGSTTDWWTEGRTLTFNDTQCFFKLDDVRLRCKSFFRSGYAIPIYTDTPARLIPDQWYYYDVDCGTEYILQGQLDGLVYTFDEDMDNTATTAVTRNMALGAGRVFFKTTRSDATLRITPSRTFLEGTFTAVALNVDGLPNKIATYDLNPDGPGRDGTLKISQYLASKDYDFIGCSEDFNYNGALMESLNGYSCGTIRNTLSVGDLDYWQLIQGKIHVDTDGLNLIWKNGTVTATNESWTGWNDTESTDGNQYVEKGYRHYDVQLDGGPTIDVYILHMDAGDTNATWSRESQWRQLSDAINASDHSRAKLIIGDTNSRYTREDVISNFINLLSDDFTMGDVWVDFYRDGIYPTTAMDNLTDQSDPTNYSNYEIVDKIIYINPKAANTVHLTPQSFRIEQDYTYGNVEGTDDTTPLGDHRPVVVTFKYMVSGNVSPLAVSLQDNADNSTAIAAVTGALSNVTLEGRTLWKDNAWNTLCLPFNMSAEQISDQLTDATLMELDVTTTDTNGYLTRFDNDGVLRLYFADANTIEAGKPYIIKWPIGDHLVNPLFSSVTPSVTTPQPVTSNDGNIHFNGLFAPALLTPDTPANLYLTDDNKLCNPSVDNFYVNAMRCYFTINLANEVKSFRLQIGDATYTGSFFDGETAIEDITAGQSPDSQWYTLDGRKLPSRPTTPGVYIVNRKKIVLP